MNRVLILILLISSLTSFAQDTTKTRYKFFIGIGFSPDYCYRTQINKSIPDSIWSYAKSFYDSVQTTKFGYTTGINFGYYFNEKLFVESGILYSNKGYKTIPFKIYTSTYPTIDSTYATFILTYTYLDFPFKINYTFLKKRLKIVAGVGATLNVFLNFKLSSDPKQVMESVVVNEPSVNTINISPTISIGAQYMLSERINLRVEPSYHYAIFSTVDNSSKSEHLWSAGINLGCYYKL